jgi:hypothetical protein
MDFIKIVFFMSNIDPAKYKEGQRQDWDNVASGWQK